MQNSSTYLWSAVKELHKSLRQVPSCDKEARFLRKKTFKVSKRLLIASTVTSARFLLTRAKIILLSPSNSPPTDASILFLGILQSVSHCQDLCSLKHLDYNCIPEVYCSNHCSQPVCDGCAPFTWPLPFKDLIVFLWTEKAQFYRSISNCYCDYIGTFQQVGCPLSLFPNLGKSMSRSGE